MEDESRASEGRFKMYKTHGRDQEEMRRKRREDQVQIRKSRREEMFDKNRRITVEHTLSDSETSEIMRTIVDGLQSMQPAVIQETVILVLDHMMRESWTASHLAHIEILNKLADIYCNRSVDSSIRQLIAQLFSKISGENETEFSRQSPDEICISSLVTVLSTHPSEEEVLCDALQALSCFLIRSIVYRNLALDNAVVPELLELCSLNLSVHMKRSLVWIVSLFCEKLTQYSPHVDEIAPMLEVIASGIRSQDSMIQNDAATACVYLAEWTPINEHIQAYGLCTLLVTNLCNDNGNARPTVQWAISSIIQATSCFTKEMIDAGLLEKLKGFVNVSYMSQEVCFLISNICAEGADTISKVISSDILREVFRVMESAEYRSRKEAAFIICHCCASPVPAHLQYLLDSGMLSSFIDLLTCMDATLVQLILEALDSLLNYGENYLAHGSANPIAERLEELGCREKLDFLTESQSMSIHVKAYTILDRYFNDENEQIEETELNGYDLQQPVPHRSPLDDTIEFIVTRTMQSQ